MLRIRSGGQSGADRAALDWALANGVSHCGWCPRGRRSEDGPIASRYRLRETPSDAYEERTAWNVRDSDATVVFSLSATLTGGTLHTREVALTSGRPLLHVRSDDARALQELGAFLAEHSVRDLNVAGPRGSDEPTVGSLVDACLSAVLGSRQVVRRALRPRAVAAFVPLRGLQLQPSSSSGPAMGVISLMEGRNVLGRLANKLPPHMANYVRVHEDDQFVSSYHASIVVIEGSSAGALPMVTVECMGGNGMQLVRRSVEADEGGDDDQRVVATELRRGIPRVPVTIAEGDTLCMLPGGAHPYRLLVAAGVADGAAEGGAAAASTSNGNGHSHHESGSGGESTKKRGRVD